MSLLDDIEPFKPKPGWHYWDCPNCGPMSVHDRNLGQPHLKPTDWWAMMVDSPADANHVPDILRYPEEFDAKDRLCYEQPPTA